MPLRAKVNNQDVVASLISKERWDELRRQKKTEGLEILLPCCAGEGHMRTSKLGMHRP